MSRVRSTAAANAKTSSSPSAVITVPWVLSPLHASAKADTALSKRGRLPSECCRSMRIPWKWSGLESSKSNVIWI